MISSDLCSVIKKILDKMSCQKKIVLKSKYALGAWSPGKWLSLEVCTSNFFDLIFKLVHIYLNGAYIENVCNKNMFIRYNSNASVQRITDLILHDSHS